MLDVDGNVISPSELIARVENLLKSAETGLAQPTGDRTWSQADASVAHANALAVLREQLVLPDLVSTPGPLSPLRRLVKQVVRKLTWWYVEPRWRVQSDIDTHAAHFAAAVVNEQGRATRELEQLRRQQVRLSLQAARSLERLGVLRDELEAGKVLHDHLQQEVARTTKSIERLGQVSVTTGLFESLRNQVTTLMSRLGVASAAGPDIDYVAFEERFRGGSEDLQESQAEYLRYFLPPEHPGEVIDIGCGRGEMLDALTSAGHVARGVDSNTGMVELCRSKGLDVVEGDAINFLDTLDADSLKGIFCAQVVEHLLTSEIQRLTHLAAAKLIPGGALVIETINPRSFHAFANHFLADASHVRPVHPETLRFICEQSGFSTVALVEKSRHALADVPEDIPEGGVRDSLAHLLASVYGYQDYAIVATK